MTNTFGLTARQFFESLGSDDLRRFIVPEVLSVLDPIFGGRICGDELLSVVTTLVDIGELLGEPRSRQLVLDLVPERKRAELRDRLELSEHETLTALELDGAGLRRLREFFGIYDNETLTPTTPSSSTVVPAYDLFDHQRGAVQKLMPVLAQDNRRAVLHLPTGVGKTRTAMHIVAQYLCSNEPSVVVWLASGSELLEQAVDSFRIAWGHLGNRPVSVETMWGTKNCDLDDFTDGFLAIGLSKAWALMSREDPGWAARLAARVRLVVFDEAHQSIANTYRRVTEELTLDYRCALLGLTATPGRTWADLDKDGVLAEFYGYNKIGLDVPAENPITYLIENKFLAKPNFRTIFAEPGLSLTDQEIGNMAVALDIPRQVLDALSIGEKYIVAVLNAIEQLFADGHHRVLVFAASVRHARVLTAILAARGLFASVVTGLTPEQERRRAIRNFTQDSNGRPMALVNFGVLTTGFDAPKASAVVIARPTQSLVLYSQMVGRAIRGPKAGGTEHCEVVTVVDPSLPGFGDVAAAFENWEDVW